MKYLSYLPFLFSLLLLACGDSQDSQGLDSDDFMDGDSVFVIMEDTEPSEISIDLLGIWKLVDMRMDGKSYLDEPLDKKLEFQETGILVESAEDLPPRKSDFAQAGDFISAPEIWDEDLKIKSLSPTKLVFTEEVSGQIVEYHYEKEQN